MQGALDATLTKNGMSITRNLNTDRLYSDPKGDLQRRRGRSLLFVCNVGHLMTTPAILDGGGSEIPEGILDAMVTSLAAIHDLGSDSSQPDYRGNSRTGSVYIVKPKRHGPAEVSFTNE